MYLYIDKANKTINTTKVMEKDQNANIRIIVNTFTPNGAIDDKPVCILMQKNIRELEIYKIKLRGLSRLVIFPSEKF